MKEKIIKSIEKFKGYRVGVVGDLILDEYIFGTAERISPEAPVPVVLQKNREIRPGGAANVAFNLAELGARVTIFGVVGYDPYADELKTLLENRGLNTSGIVRDASRPTTVKTRIIAHRQQIVRLDREKTEPIDNRTRDALLASLKSASDDLDAIIFEDYNKGTLSKDMILNGIDMFEGKFRAVDPKFHNFWEYRGVELFKPNRKELLNAMPDSPDAASEFVHSIREAHRRLGARYLLVTVGEDGMYIVEDERTVHVPAHKRDVYDVTGAGDTVIAVVVLAMLAGLPIEDAALMASIAAGIEVSKLGTATVSPSELIENIEENWDQLKSQIKSV